MKKCSRFVSAILLAAMVVCVFSGCRYDWLIGDLALIATTTQQNTVQPETTLPPTVETTLPPTVETTLPPVVETTLPPTVETTLPPVVETTLPPVVETTLPPVVETTTQPQQKTPDTMSNAELLEFFNSSLNAVKSKKAGLTRSKLTTMQDLVLSNSVANSLVGLVKGMLLSEETEYESVTKGNSSDNVLSPSGKTYASSLTMSDIKSISVQQSGSNYVITVYGVDCENPTEASSCAKLFDYLTIDDVMNIYVPKVGATVDRSNVSVAFKNSYAVLTVAADGTVSSYETHTYNYLTMKDASIKKGVTINTDLDVTLYTVTKYYDIAY